MQLICRQSDRLKYALPRYRERRLIRVGWRYSQKRRTCRAGPPKILLSFSTKGVRPAACATNIEATSRVIAVPFLH
jgi:hypothetical protein